MRKRRRAPTTHVSARLRNSSVEHRHTSMQHRTHQHIPQTITQKREKAFKRSQICTRQCRQTPPSASNASRRTLTTDHREATTQNSTASRRPEQTHAENTSTKRFKPQQSQATQASARLPQTTMKHRRTTTRHRVDYNRPTPRTQARNDSNHSSRIQTCATHNEEFPHTHGHQVVQQQRDIRTQPALLGTSSTHVEPAQKARVFKPCECPRWPRCQKWRNAGPTATCMVLHRTSTAQPQCLQRYSRPRHPTQCWLKRGKGCSSRQHARE